MKQNYRNIKEFYSNLYIKYITDADYIHGKIVCKHTEIKHLGEHHGFYFKSDVLLLAAVFEKFREICLQIYELDWATFI